MQGDTSTHVLRRRMVVALARATKDHDHTTAIALRSTLAVLASAEAVQGRASARGRASDLPGQELTDLEVAGIVAAEAEQRERAAARYREAGDPRRATRMLSEAEVLRAFLDD
ncbi:GatB/YqeY domain-containing protein [Nocardioides aurantiacus]|uniref:YqeY-like protein n=1 Tax=Nocardioides aurantiacus TaxID=86796 RepID=A0A3N2CQH7_9ACTN|nr:GatB/YqeY domain-containing protein [Nocardioides aurantiacus]ROR89648.1 YqeY-like protein [Nocardioides aurantiacus]